MNDSEICLVCKHPTHGAVCYSPADEDCCCSRIMVAGQITYGQHIHEPIKENEMAHLKPEIKNYVKKPVSIEAVLWDGTVMCATDIINWVLRNGGTARYSEGIGRGAPVLSIDTLEGTIFASKGDYVIRGIKGEFYPCKPDVFEESYGVKETDGEMLERLGTDGRKWAEEFLKIYHSGDHLLEAGWMVSWFANAIEAGRTAGYIHGREVSDL